MAPGPETYLVLDIETIPDPELYTPPEPAAGMERPFPPLTSTPAVPSSWA